VYGEGQRHDSEYSAVIPKFLNDKEIKINGDGSIIRDFTYVKDVVDCIDKCLSYDKISDVFNVCTGVGTTIKELADMCKGNDSIIKYGEARKTDVHKSIGNPSYAQTRLGFKAKHNLKETIEGLKSGKGKEKP
jgi:UDP-glucose 4-epimerase